jgi:hypothetical protein
MFESNPGSFERTRKRALSVFRADQQTRTYSQALASLKSPERR